jgi:hypothetical protein
LLRPLASGFNPRSISGLGMWLDASVTSSLTLNGNTVSEWRDLSGNGRHVSQATAAAQPDAAGRTQNGRRVIDFDGGDFLLGNAASLTTLRNVPAATACIAARFDQTARNGALFNFATSTGSAIARFQMGQNSTVGGTYAGGRRLDADSFASAFFADNTNAQVLTGIADYANSDVFIYSAGTLQASNTSFQTNGNTENTSHSSVSLGNNSNNLIGSQAHDGWIGELLVWPRVLTDAERQRVERYLGRKWGITVA